jgi:hypothetical protein
MAAGLGLMGLGIGSHAHVIKLAELLACDFGFSLTQPPHSIYTTNS